MTALSPKGCKLVGGLLMCTLVALSGVRVAANWQGLGPMRAGEPAPDFELPVIGPTGDVSGERISLHRLKGQVVVLDFWEAWCQPCRQAMPVLARVEEAYRNQGVVFLSINTEGPDGARDARELQQQLGVAPLLLSDGGAVAREYRVTTIPHLVVVDRRGMVAAVHRGFDGTAALEAFLIAELKPLL